MYVCMDLQRENSRKEGKERGRRRREGGYV